MSKSKSKEGVRRLQYEQYVSSTLTRNDTMTGEVSEPGFRIRKFSLRRERELYIATTMADPFQRCPSGELQNQPCDLILIVIVSVMLSLFLLAI